MKNMLAIGFGLLILSPAFGGDRDVDTRVADAETRCQQAIEAAEAVEAKAEVKALNDLLATLEQARAEEVNVDTVLALDNRIAGVKDRLGILTGKRITIEIPANAGWIRFGKVIKGQHLHVTATGEWMENVHDEATRVGPEGRHGDNKWRLIGVINGDSGDVPLDVKSELDFVVPESGLLSFGMFGSNKNAGGKVEVTVIVVN